MEPFNFLLSFYIQPYCKGKHVQAPHFCQCGNIMNGFFLWECWTAISAKFLPLQQNINLICHLSSTHWPFCEISFCYLRAQVPNLHYQKNNESHHPNPTVFPKLKMQYHNLYIQQFWGSYKQMSVTKNTLSNIS